MGIIIIILRLAEDILKELTEANGNNYFTLTLLIWLEASLCVTELAISYYIKENLILSLFSRSKAEYTQNLRIRINCLRSFKRIIGYNCIKIIRV